VAGDIYRVIIHQIYMGLPWKVQQAVTMCQRKKSPVSRLPRYIDCVKERTLLPNGMNE